MTESQYVFLIEGHEQYTQTSDAKTVVPKGAAALALTSGGYSGKKGREKSRDKSKNNCTQAAGDK